MLLQPAIGQLLEIHWAGQLANGSRVYDLHAYQSAFLLIAGWSVLACLLISTTRETFCKPHA
jgi:hypothetical protein